MAKRNTRAVLRDLEVLQTEAPTLRKKGADSEEFRDWHARTTKTLQQAVGARSDIVAEFKRIRFSSDPEALDAIGKRLKRVAIALPKGDKVTELYRPKLRFEPHGREAVRARPLGSSGAAACCEAANPQPAQETHKELNRTCYK